MNASGPNGLRISRAAPVGQNTDRAEANFQNRRDLVDA